jgi:GT2 family glycosyltransferase
MSDSGGYRGESHAGAEDQPGVAIVVLTHNRVHLLRQCVDNVLAATSALSREIVIWDNGSTDGTHEYLSKLEDPRIRTLRSETNIGQNAYARAFALTSAEYLVELDDDVVEAPLNWDATLLDAYLRLPTIGFLAADLVDDPNDLASQYRYRIRPHEYTPTEINGVPLLIGPTGGACAMTSRDLYDRVGGFRQDSRFVFWQEEPAYIEDIGRLGFTPAVLANLKVHHTGGEFYGATSVEKDEFWAHFWRRQDRRAWIKRMVFRVPFFRRLNARFAWFVAPP